MMGPLEWLILRECCFCLFQKETDDIGDGGGKLLLKLHIRIIYNS